MMRTLAAGLLIALMPLAAGAEPSAAQRAAAERGDPPAQFALALHYDTGTPTNYPEALRWFSRAAEAGYAVAEAKLGLMYLYGWSVPADAETAVYWYKRAAHQGHVQAQVQMGRMFLKGLGVPRDPAQARHYLSQAAAQGNAWAAWRLER